MMGRQRGAQAAKKPTKKEVMDDIDGRRSDLFSIQTAIRELADKADQIQAPPSELAQLRNDIRSLARDIKTERDELQDVQEAAGQDAAVNFLRDEVARLAQQVADLGADVRQAKDHLGL